MILIMLIGQPGSGKTTLGKQIQLLFKNSKIINYDQIASSKISYLSNIDSYIQQINIDLKKNYDFLILDFTQDLISSRKYILDRLDFIENVFLLTITLRTHVSNIFNRLQLRDRDNPLEKIKKRYEQFEYPIKEEFDKYPIIYLGNLEVNN